MPTSDASWSASLRLIGDLERPDHWYLTSEDECAFFGEYKARAGYGHSSTNQLIHNLKKKPELRGTPQWRYKGLAITEIARLISANLNPDTLAGVILVPIPPSKPVGHPEYDDRMAQVARAVGRVEVREILYTASEREAAHISANHRDPDALRASLGVHADLAAPAPSQVILLDDVLTTGCSFKVCKSIALEIWPQAQVFGLFVARRVVERLDPAVVFGDIDL